MAEPIRIDQMAPDAAEVARCVEVLGAGGVVVIPTDSVYGIACAAFADNPAHARIFEIKHRERSQTLPLLVGLPEDLPRLSVELPDFAEALAERYWPGALTLVVRASETIPPEYVAQDGTVALRCPDSPFVREVIAALGMPLACTSANTHGLPAPVSDAELEQGIIVESELVFAAGRTPVREASTIVDCTEAQPFVLREGALPSEEVTTWPGR